MTTPEEVFVICVDIFSDHTPDSLKVKCNKCGKKLWCSPHHIEEKRKPICIYCVQKVEDPEFGIDVRDVSRAKKEIKRREEENPTTCS